MNPSSFSSSRNTEDPENFVEELKKVFDVMHVVGVERVELVANQLNSVAGLSTNNVRRTEMRMCHI